MKTMSAYAMSLQKAKKFFTRFLCLAVALVMSLTIMSPSANAYAGTVRGGVSNYYGGCTIVETCWHSKATLRICTFTSNGNRTSGKLYVKAICRDPNCHKTKEYSITGCNGWNNSSTNVTLPACHGGWDVSIKRRDTGTKNTQNTCYFSLDFMNNCYPH